MSITLAKKASIVRQDNRLLAALPDADYSRLRRQLEFVSLPAGLDLRLAGQPMAHVFFPASSTVSLLTQLMSGASTGIALIGNEGLIGVSGLLAGPRAGGTNYRAVVQNAGYAYRIPTDSLLQEFERGGELQHLLLRAAQAQILQIAQISVCNRFHKLTERLCSWLLYFLDRLPGDEICVTQSTLSSLLGVRREGVSEAERHLQCASAIEYARGHIHVTDRPALERRACECYAVITREYARLAPLPRRRGLASCPPNRSGVEGIGEAQWRQNAQS